ncbi:MAG: acyl carrier protein [Paludibacteraceae bacterium]|nr:acyl carrier protein [Paludibacteraceae bacterium]
MDEKQFIQYFAEQFDETDASQLTLDTKFRDIDEWSSVIALSVMAMCAEEYDVILSANEMENANRISDVYNIVKAKTNK